MNMGLSRYEQETVINLNAAENTATLYTADPVWMRKLDALTEKNPEQFKLIEVVKSDGTVTAKRYSFPKRFVCLRSVDRKVTEEQRAQAAERMKRMHEINSTLKTPM